MTDLIDWNASLLAQLDWHWDNQLRPRLDGLSDEEYFWEPPGLSGPVWSVRPRGTGTAPVQGGSGDFTIDWEMPQQGPQHAAFTTIAWRLGHVIVGVLAIRNASHFDGPATDYFQWDYAGTAAQALAQLDHEIAHWRHGVAALGTDGLARPCGPAEGGFAELSMADLVLHIHREIIHHGAEISLLRDLFEQGGGR